jgi:hypothetical protein
LSTTPNPIGGLDITRHEVWHAVIFGQIHTWDCCSRITFCALLGVYANALWQQACAREQWLASGLYLRYSFAPYTLSHYRASSKYRGINMARSVSNIKAHRHPTNHPSLRHSHHLQLRKPLRFEDPHQSYIVSSTASHYATNPRLTALTITQAVRDSSLAQVKLHWHSAKCLIR